MRKYNDICFYSNFGAGDLFNSRMIIKEIVESYPDTSFYYAHTKDPKTFADIPRIKHARPELFMHSMKPFINGQRGELYINTWIGRDGKYVLPGIGCTLEKYIEMFDDILSKVGLGKLRGSTEDYIPVIDYKLLGLEDLFSFMEFQYRKRVFVSNGDVHSNQAKNFDFSPIIERLCDTFEDCAFYVTASVNFSKPNLYDLSQWDLNSLSYKSTKCDFIIGRSSGPYVYAQVKDNLFNANMTFLSFTYHENAAKLFTTIHPPARMIWSSEENEDKVLAVIKEYL